MWHWDPMLIDPPGKRGHEGLAQVQRELVPVQIEIDPSLGAAPLAAAQHVTIELTRLRQVRDMERQMEKTLHVGKDSSKRLG
ncbi:MAG: hypothetical protein Fur007_03170 [Rhodoferax sp.]